MSLRLVSLVASVVPPALCRGIAGHLARRLGEDVEAAVLAAEPDPFADGRADAGWISAASYPGLGSVRLLGVAAVDDDPRNDDRPVAYAELVVHADAPQQCVDDLRGAHFAFDDDSSLGGKVAMLDRLIQGGHGIELLASLTASGSHEQSMRLVAESQADCAAIDAGVFRRAEPRLRRRLRVIETLGPFPADPVVVHPELDARRAEALRALLLDLGRSDPDLLARHGIRRFAAVGDDDYRPWAARVEAARALLCAI